MNDLASTETVDTTTADTSASISEAPATATGASGGETDGENTGASDVRAAQIEALKSARERDGGQADSATEKTEPKTGATKDPATGKFVSSKPSDPEAQKPATDPKSPEPDKQPTTEAPAHLAPDIKAVWSKLPPDAQDAISARTLEDRKAISRLGNTVKAFEPFVEVAKSHQDYFERNQAHPASVFNNLMAWNQVLENDPVTHFPKLVETYGIKPAEAQAIIGAMAKQYGLSVSPTQRADDFSLPPDPTTIALQSEVEQIKRMNAQLMSRLGQYEGSVRQLTQAQQEEINARAEQARAIEDSKLVSAVDAFKSTMDPQEYEVLQPFIARELMNLDPSIPDKDALKTATENARKKLDGYLQPKISAVDKTRQEQAAKAAAAAKRAGSINVEGAAQSAPVAMNIREEQRAALARARQAQAH